MLSKIYTNWNGNGIQTRRVTAHLDFNVKDVCDLHN